MKATQVKTIQQRISFFRRVECETGLLVDADKLECVDEGGPVDQIREKLILAHNLAWALQIYPLFDPGCLSRMVVQHFVDLKPRWHNGNEAKTYTGDLWVPAFAAHRFKDGSRTTVTRNPLENGINLCGQYVGNYPEKNLELNRLAFAGNQGFQIEATSPRIPASVRSRVEPVLKRFESVDLVFEAEWAPADIKDPLVIGRIAESFFLVDEFDVTKLERYVSSEFTTKARDK